jgi:hypothetical protein
MKRLQAHHIKPFHLFPELELVESNWVPLCEGNPSMNCHLVLGHLGNFASYNLLVVADASKWLARMLGRP